jgi:flavin-dependent dehydrogenase
MKARFDAIIMGAGPAGSSAAIWLAQAGWSVGLIEKQAFPRRKVCGECLAASNMPLLKSLGIEEDFLAQAGPEIRQVAVMRGADTVAADMPPCVPQHAAWGHALGREFLDTLLLERARSAGVVVLQPWSVQTISGDAGNFQCSVRESVSGRATVLQARTAILANGSWETLAGDRCVKRRKRTGADLLAFKANFVNSSLAAGILPILLFNGGYGGMVLADNGQVTLACCIRADRLELLRHASPGHGAGDVVHAMLMRECRGVADALHHAQRVGPWLASGPLSPGIRLHSEDPILRIGNAAGEAHPIIGEGMSMALQSAWMLSNCLIHARNVHGADTEARWHASVREQYAAQWRQRFLVRLRLAYAFAHLAMRPATAGALIALLKRWPALLTHGATWGGKVTLANT